MAFAKLKLKQRIFVGFISVGVVFYVVNQFRLLFWTHLQQVPASIEGAFFSSTNKPLSNTIAYTLSLTSCKADGVNLRLYDAAAVLKHSIHLNSIQTPSSGSKYDYHMVAFVHPEAVNCSGALEALGYEIKVRDTPIDVKEIQSEYYRSRVVKGGCCQEKEFLKLHSFTLVDYPVVVHLDADTLILQPLDDLFDSIITNGPSAARNKLPAMWYTHDQSLPHQIDAFFTRDYAMLVPKDFYERRQRTPNHAGVQGGFLVVRPDLEVFEKYRQVILEGNFAKKTAWGDGYGLYYGDQTIQGLCSYFYGHVRPGTAVELNRCRYNQMADQPMFIGKTPSRCLTGERTCEDCRIANFTNVKSVHFTLCGKPWWCEQKNKGALGICGKFLTRWFQVRRSLEDFWAGEITMPSLSIGGWDPAVRRGFCNEDGNGGIYIPIRIPNYTIDSS